KAASKAGPRLCPGGRYARPQGRIDVPGRAAGPRHRNLPTASLDRSSARPAVSPAGAERAVALRVSDLLRAVRLSGIPARGGAQDRTLPARPPLRLRDEFPRPDLVCPAPRQVVGGGTVGA